MLSRHSILVFSSLALLMLCAGLCGGGYALFRRLTAPRVVVWDLTQDQTTAAVGWTPKNYLDVDYSISGDIDFTLRCVGPEGPMREFHERCFGIGVFRWGQTNRLGLVYAHFARNITAEEAVVVAKRVLSKWSGGIRDGNGETPPNVDDWLKSIQAGIKPHRQESYIVAGANGGTVRINLLSSIAKDKGKTRCNLTFSTQ